MLSLADDDGDLAEVGGLAGEFSWAASPLTILVMGTVEDAVGGPLGAVAEGAIVRDADGEMVGNKI